MQAGVQTGTGFTAGTGVGNVPNTAGSGVRANAGTGSVAVQAGTGSRAAGSLATAGVAGATLGAAGQLALAGSSGAAAVSGAGAAGAAGAAGVSGASGVSGLAGTGGGAAGAAAAGTAAPSGEGIPGCEGSTLLAVPDDATQRGPWPVGDKTIQFGRFSAVEVFYPAQPGSEQGKQPVTFDLRKFLPKDEQSKVPDAEATLVDAKTFRDLPLDTEHGPYPVVILVHGTASFRVASLSSQALWASRGFVVIAADHPGLYLADYLGCGGQVAGRVNLSGDVDSELSALSTPDPELAFLTGHIDLDRVALVGHSAGAYNVAQFSTKKGVQMVIGLAGTRAVSRSSTLKSVLYVAGQSDSVLPYGPGGTGLGSILYPGSDVDAYNASPGPSAVKKRLVGIKKGGHLTVTDLCKKNAMNQSDLEVAQAHGVCGVGSVVPLADCGTADPAAGIAITNDIMTAALEETLQCQDRAAVITALESRHPEVGDFREAVQ